MANSVFGESDVELSSNMFYMYAQFTAMWRVDETPFWDWPRRHKTCRHFQGDVTVDDDDCPPCRSAVAAVIVDGKPGEEREEREVDALTYRCVDKPRTRSCTDSNLGSSHTRQVASRLRQRNTIKQRARLGRARIHCRTFMSFTSNKNNSLAIKPIHSRPKLVNIISFLQRVSIACYAERCISHDRFCLTDRLTVWPSDRPTVRPSQSGIMPKRLQLRSCGLHWTGG